MALLSPLTPAESIGAGDLVYELILSNWGNWGAKRDPGIGSVQYPSASFVGVEIPVEVGAQALGSVFALAIAQRSDVDRCIVRYDTHRSQSLPRGQPRFLNNGGIFQSETKISVASPFIGQLAGPIVIRADPAHWFADNYVPANVATPSPLPPFGTALGPSFINPELRLLLYLSSKVFLPPPARVPFYNEFVRPFTATETGVEVLTRVVPVMGRMRTRVTFVVSGGVGPGSNVDVRVTGTFTGVAPSTPATNPIPNVTVHELPLAGPTTIDASVAGTATFEIDHPQVSFLLLKATPSVAGVTLRAAIEARD
jgi:hypothetical protein